MLLILITMEDEKRVLDIIKDSGEGGRTITEIVKISRLPRSVIRILLARLEGAEAVGFRKVGMAKIYSLNPKSVEVMP